MFCFNTYCIFKKEKKLLPSHIFWICNIFNKAIKYANDYATIPDGKTAKYFMIIHETNISQNGMFFSFPLIISFHVCH